MREINEFSKVWSRKNNWTKLFRNVWISRRQNHLNIPWEKAYSSIGSKWREVFVLCLILTFLGTILIFIWGRFHQTFLQSKKLPAHGFWQKIRSSFHQQINKAKIRSKFAKTCTPFAKHYSPRKGVESCEKFAHKFWWNQPLKKQICRDLTASFWQEQVEF